MAEHPLLKVMQYFPYSRVARHFSKALLVGLLHLPYSCSLYNSVGAFYAKVEER